MPSSTFRTLVYRSIRSTAGSAVRSRVKPAVLVTVAALGCIAFAAADAPAQVADRGGEPEEGRIEGVVRTADGAAAPGINVSLEGTDRGSSTDPNGRYVIAGVEPGSYTLVLSHVGLETRRRAIRVAAGEALEIPPIQLAATVRELEEIVVEGSRGNVFDAEATEYVAKLPLEKLENPQVYDTITAELLDDQLVTAFEDALRNAPGLFKLWASTGRGGDGAGYYSLRGFAIQPTMVDGLPALTNGTPDPAHVERIEVIKGPSGTLYGSSLVSYGGLINVVTEKPYASFGGEVAYRAGSFGLNRLTADVNTPIGEEVALRVNGAYHSQNSFQDAGFRESLFLAPSLSVEAGDRVSFLVDAEYYESEQTNPTMLFLNRYAALEAHSVAELGYDPEHSYTGNDVTIRTPTLNVRARMRVQVADGWTSRTALSRSSARSQGYYSYLWGLSDGAGTFTRYVSDQNSTTLATNLQQNLVGEFAVGGLENRLVLGADYFRRGVVNNSTGYVGVDQISLEEEGTPGLSRSRVDAALAEASATNTRTREERYSVYGSDVVHVLPRLSLMGSLRLDYFDSAGTLESGDDDFTQTALSPKLGVVLEPFPERLSLFANYMNGFSNVEPRTQDDGSTKTFEPEQADQWETGIKARLGEDRLTATVSYYDITVSHVVREDPDRANFYVQDGENYSRGIEANLTAAPTRGLNLILGYSYNEAEITRTDDPDYRGRRPEQAGPKNQLNGWASYRVGSGAFEGLRLGFGGNYAGENWILNRATTGRFTLPSHTVLNASIGYESPRYRLALTVNNLADEQYYTGWTTVNPQAPRNVTASISYDF